MSPTLPVSLEIEGWIVLNGFKHASTSHYLLEPATGATRDLPVWAAGAEVRSEQVSPDARWLAYRDETYSSPGVLGASSLIVVDANGLVAASIPWDDSWRHIAGWLDNERLLISRMQGGDNYDSILVFDPFRASRLNELASDFPGIYASYPDPNWGWFDASKTIYDVDLSRVVYPGLVDQRGESQLFLRDLQTNQSILVITGTLSFGVVPQWSPDGKRFVISGPSTLLSANPEPDPLGEHQELFTVTRDGVVTQITNLNQYYSYVNFDAYAWSPDGRYIAFSLRALPSTYPDLYSTTEPDMYGRLVVLDMATGDITDYCLPHGETRTAPIWSPSGQQLVFEDYYRSQPPVRSKVYLVDLTAQIAAVIADDVTPVGWLAGVP